jgi:NNP family nitrate/nitrite transporter-like MFS transporter
MFARSVVGTANATSGGWGNLGGGVTQLVMPYVMLGFMGAVGNDGPGVDKSWRLCMIVPAALHAIASILVIMGRDLPDGNFKELETSGAKQKSQGGKAVLIGFSNINAWILTVTYGFCFGVELTMNNVVVLYFYRYYGVSPQIAGILGSCFGLMNIFARSWGGMLSDILNAKYGMRGRLWSMWVCQVLEGLMCLIMGLITIGMPSPDRKMCPDGSLCPTEAADRVWGKFQTTNPPVGSAFTYGVTYTYRVNSTNAAFIRPCGSESIARPNFAWLQAEDGSETLLPVPSTEDFLVVGDVDNMDCVRNTGTLGVTMIAMILFSIFVQMAEGLHFGVVPYVSRPALGVVSGMVGAGGNCGAVFATKVIFGAAGKAPDQGLIELGIVIMATSLIMHFIYFPENGAMLCKAGALGKYDPQLYKPAVEARGADQMDYSNVKGAAQKADA